MRTRTFTPDAPEARPDLVALVDAALIELGTAGILSGDKVRDLLLDLRSTAARDRT